MTIPTLVASHQKEVAATQLEKVYSEIGQILKRSEADNIMNLSTTTIATLMADDVYNKYWKPYLANPKICNKPKDCGYNPSVGVYPWKMMNGDSFIYNMKDAAGRTHGINVIDTDFTGANTRFLLQYGTGTVIFYPIGNRGAALVQRMNLFVVDINGSKSPNRLGRDVFVFKIDENSVVKPMDDEKYKNDCKKGSTGLSCSLTVFKAGWKMDKSYPW